MSAHIESNNWVKPKVVRPLFGNQVDRITWVWEFESLAAYEEWHEAFDADEGTLARVAKMGDIFVPDSMVVQAYKTVL